MPQAPYLRTISCIRTKSVDAVVRIQRGKAGENLGFDRRREDCKIAGSQIANQAQRATERKVRETFVENVRRESEPAVATL
jgi:hypothetical protein